MNEKEKTGESQSSLFLRFDYQIIKCYNFVYTQKRNGKIKCMQL